MFGHYGKIELLLQQGRLDEAENEIRAMLVKSMEDEWLHVLLADTLCRKNRPKEAEKSARMAIGQAPDWATAHFFLARALLDQERRQESLAAIDEAIRLDPDDADCFAMKAQILMVSGKLERALEAAETGLVADPDHEGSRGIRSILLGRLGRVDEARAASDELLSDDPDDSWNFTARGWVLIEANDGNGAKQAFMEALRLDPQNEGAKDGLGHAINLGNPVLGSLIKGLNALDRVPVWALVVGIVLLMQGGSWLAKSSLPGPVQSLGVVIKSVMFSLLVLGVVIGPLFHLGIRCSKGGKFLLSRDQIQAIRWSVFPLALGTFFLIVWIFGGSKLAPIHAMTWMAVARLAHEVFEDPNPWLRKAMGWLAWVAFAGALWVEYASYAIVLPKFLEVMETLNSAMLASNQGGDLKEIAKEQLGDDFKADLLQVAKLRNHLVAYPAIALFFLGVFSDDIRSRLQRYAPDAD